MMGGRTRLGQNGYGARGGRCVRPDAQYVGNGAVRRERKHGIALLRHCAITALRHCVVFNLFVTKTFKTHTFDGFETLGVCLNA